MCKDKNIVNKLNKLMKTVPRHIILNKWYSKNKNKTATT